ncbi:OLC1v1024632C1 [Oldenlandia corymbosa var. corymbosa]|uniref:OLC1v1024632C1 n=1 Tax=Oldenlandia corymbosa var. corymbosa TaxID=529605 RepID=A0AAV1C2W1_OLDCO|nr:OLC1v1024632C1 [Oldenlandia corymbosa var. corymbosa]
MVQFQGHDTEEAVESMAENAEKKFKFCVNDNIDVLIEILKRLDGRSLAVAACVCQLWCAISRNDSLWEHLCFFQASPPTAAEKTVVAALGGYKRLYMVCVRPVMNTLKRFKRVRGRCGGAGAGGELELVRRVWTRREVELALSLFCVDYYERVLISGGGGGGGGGESSALSLMFLCKALNA